MVSMLNGANLALDGLSISLAGPEFPLKVALKQLEFCGRTIATQGTPGIECDLSWRPQTSQVRSADTEATIQAVSGLMAVHGREAGLPRRVGLDVASVAAGILAVQGILAGLISRRRGWRISRVQTSILEAALTFLCHHVAIATCGEAHKLGRMCGIDPEGSSCSGPPFPTQDAHTVEFEILHGGIWIEFWKLLGVTPSAIQACWIPFASRYITGCCRLSKEFHEATARVTLAELQTACDRLGVAMCRVRSYQELLPEIRTQGDNRKPWHIHSNETTVGYVKELEQSAGPLPLSGFKVIEVATRLQGPLAGQLLRALGANVIKVEPPGGDPFRLNPPLAGKQSAAYVAYNHGKNVVEVDYKQPGGLAAILDLVRDADVFLHNWPTSRAAKLCLDAQSLSRVNPRLIYAHASAWGSSGSNEPTPYAGDYLVQAHAGLGQGLNPADEPPRPSRVTFVDVAGGLMACTGILAGLYRREISGAGSSVETSLFSAAMTVQARVLGALACGDEQGRSGGRAVWGILDKPVRTADGYLMINAEDDPARQKLAQICGAATSQDAQSIDRKIADRLLSQSASEWKAIFDDAKISSSPVCCDLARLPGAEGFPKLFDRVDGSCDVPSAPWKFYS